MTYIYIKFTLCFQLRAEKMSLTARLEQAEKECGWHKAACDELKLEVAGLQQQREQLFSQQIGDLEKRVRELSQDPASDPDTGKGVDAEVQTSVRPRLGEESEEEAGHISVTGLLRLEEHAAMLLRTGVYTHEDEVVIKVNEQIRKLRKKIAAERDN